MNILSAYVTQIMADIRHWTAWNSRLDRISFIDKSENYPGVE